MSSQQLPDVVWKNVWQSLAVALVGTLVLGGTIFFVVKPDMWWLAWISFVVLLGAGFMLARPTGRFEGMSIALVAIFYYTVTSLVLMVGMLFEMLPDPLPGLPRGDSTYFFVWPLLQLAGVFIGALIGQMTAARETRESGSAREEAEDVAAPDTA